MAAQQQWKQDTASLQRLALKCTRHYFPQTFQPWAQGEHTQQWRARCDWKEYARSWFSDMIRPFLRELRLRAAWSGAEPGPLFEYSSTHAEDKGWERAAYMSDFISRAYANLESPQAQVDLEEELVSTFAEDSSWSERYHDIFEAIAHRLEQLKWPGELTARAEQKDARHGEDFSWVDWFGERYSFTKGNQARAVEVLWREWLRGGKADGCGVTEETIGERVGSSSGRFRMADTFRNNPAFGSMIRKSSRGTYALFRHPPSG